MNNLAKLSAFLVDIEDLAKEREILPFIGIPNFLNDDVWHVLCSFQVGRKEPPPDLGISVSDGLETKDEVR